jgi:hypothetical protein
MTSAFLTTLDLLMKNHWDATADFFLDDDATFGYDVRLNDTTIAVVLVWEDKDYITCQLTTEDEEGEAIECRTIKELKKVLTSV